MIAKSWIHFVQISPKCDAMLGFVIRALEHESKIKYMGFGGFVANHETKPDIYLIQNQMVFVWVDLQICCRVHVILRPY